MNICVVEKRRLAVNGRHLYASRFSLRSFNSSDMFNPRSTLCFAENDNGWKLKSMDENGCTLHSQINPGDICYCHLRWFICQIITHCMQHTTTQQIKVVWEILCLNSICQLLIALQISLAWSVLDNYRDVHSTDKFYISARQSVNSN